jgi:hypothetical protein
LGQINLDVRSIELTLTADTFLNDEFLEANFTLNNAPGGMSIEAFHYTDDTHLTIDLAYDGSPFVGDIEDFSIEIKGAELTGGLDLTTGNMTIMDTKINSLSIPNQAMGVGDTVTVELSVDDDGNEYYYDIIGEINGFPLTNLSRTNSTSYTAEFTVTAGGGDVLAGEDIEVTNIDVLRSWSKRFGHLEWDNVEAVESDGDGNVFVIGHVSTAADLNGDGDSDDGLEETTVLNGDPGWDDDIFMSKFNSMGVHQWSKRLGGDDFSMVWDIAVDTNGDIIITGDIGDDADLDGDLTPGNLYESPPSDFYTEAFIGKYDGNNGDQEWVKRLQVMRGVYTSYSIGITVDGSDNIFTTGYIFEEGDLDGDGNVSGPADTTFYGEMDIRICKFNGLDGTPMWSKRLGSASRDSGLDVATDGSGEVIITGKINGDGDLSGDGDTDDGGEETAGHPAGYAGDDAFISKFNADGTSHRWSKRLGSGGVDVGSEVVVDGSGDVIVTGYVWETADLNGDGDTDDEAEDHLGYGGFDAYISKFNADGTIHRWSKRLGGTGNDYGYSITVDGSNNIFARGKVFETADLNGDGDTLDEAENTGSGVYDSYLTKFSHDGTHQWSRRFGKTGGRGSLVIDGSGNMILGGSVSGEGDLNGDGTIGGDVESVGYGDWDGFITWLENDQGGLNTKIVQNADAIDSTFPTISGSTIEASNAYIDLTFNEGVYHTGGTPLEAGDLQLDFTLNGGSATAADIAGVTNTSGGALTGGESQVRVALNITGVPSGSEFVEITPTDGTSVYDFAGNPMDAGESTTKTLMDQSAPTNQDAVFGASIIIHPEANVNIASSGDATNDVWFAPIGTTSFLAGSTMTTVAGDQIIIAAPATPGAYKLYVVDQAGNRSDASAATLSVNTPPVLNDQTMKVYENSRRGTLVGNITGIDVDGDTLTYTITGGNAENRFAIHPSTGKVTVSATEGLDYESHNQYQLTITATDDGAGTRTDTATLTIDVNDVDEESTISGIFEEVELEDSDESVPDEDVGEDQTPPKVYVVVQSKVEELEHQKEYMGKMRLYFSEGTATLNGEVFRSGASISQEGNHRLRIVSPAGKETVIDFSLKALSVEDKKREGLTKEEWEALIALHPTFIQYYEEYLAAYKNDLPEGVVFLNGKREDGVRIVRKDRQTYVSIKDLLEVLSIPKADNKYLPWFPNHYDILPFMAMQPNLLALKEKEVLLTLPHQWIEGELYVDFHQIHEILGKTYSSVEDGDHLFLAIFDNKRHARMRYDLIDDKLAESFMQIEGVENGRFYADDVHIKVSFGDDVLEGKEKEEGNPLQAKINQDWFEGGRVSEEGQHNLTVYFGGEEKRRLSFTIDKTKPTITGVEDKKMYTTDRTIEFDEGRGYLNGKEVSSGITVTEQGAYHLLVVDQAGNYTQLVFGINQTNGTESFFEKYNTDIVVTAKENEELRVNGDIVQGSLQISEEGEYEILRILANGEKILSTVIIDKTPPRIYGLEDQQYYNKALTIDFDEGFALLNAQKIEAKHTLSEEGHYQLIVVDDVGNQSQIEFTVDLTNPSIVGVEDGKTYQGEVTVFFDEGVAILNGTAIQNESLIDTPGKYHLQVTDLAGNVTTVSFHLLESKDALDEALLEEIRRRNLTGIVVVANGNIVNFAKYNDVKPRIKNGRTLIPIRALAEHLQEKVSWNHETRIATFVGQKTIELKPSDEIAKVDQKRVELDVPATITDGRMIIPIRFIAEGFGYTVGWYEIGSDLKLVIVKK